MQKINAPLMTPKAAVAAVQPLTESWYSIQAKANSKAEVWLYDEIGAWGISARQFAQDITALGDIKHIDVRIHSPGGDVFEGMAIYNLLKNHPAVVHAHIDGLAASMASVIAMAADVIHMPENAMMMIHKPWGIQGGDADEMRKYADLLDKVEGSLTSAYVKKSGKSEEDIKALLKSETWYTGAEAVQAGFADQLTETLKAVASLQSHRMQEFTNMPEALKALLNPKGNAAPAAKPAAAPAPAPAAPVAAPAPQAAPQPAPAQPAAQIDMAAIKAQLQADETKRRADIQAVFAGFDHHAPLMSECMLDMSVDASLAKDKLLKALGANTTATGSVHVYADNGQIITDSLRNAIESRAKIGTIEKDNAFNGYTLMEMARASLAQRGVGIAGMDRMGIVGMAFTHSSSDFGNLLADVAHKSMLKGYEEAQETFQLWTSKGILTDFREASRVDLSTFPSLDRVPEGAEYKYGSVGDKGEKIMLATYGKLFSITRQSIINDDLSALTRIPKIMGRAAIRSIGDLVYAVLTGNPKMSDGKALFHADHKNLQTAAALSVASISAAMTGMRLQEDKNATLDIRPKHLITSVANEATAKALLLAEFDPALAEAKVPNPIRSMLDVISDPRLDAANVGANFMAADSDMYDTIEVAYLDGNDKPYIEQQEGFTRDGATFKVRIDAGVAPLSSRTMVKMPTK